MPRTAETRLTRVVLVFTFLHYMGNNKFTTINTTQASSVEQVRFIEVSAATVSFSKSMDINNVSTHPIPCNMCPSKQTNPQTYSHSTQTLADHITLLENHARLLADAAGRFRSIHSAQSDELQAMALRAYQSMIEAHKARDILKGLAQGNPQGQEGVRSEPAPVTSGHSRAGSTQESAITRKRASEDRADIPVSGSAKRRRVVLDAALTDLDANVEYEDISEEVEARLQRQEQRRREASSQIEKQGTKRKRERDLTGSLEYEGSRKGMKTDRMRPRTALNPHADWTSERIKRDWDNLPSADKEELKERWLDYNGHLQTLAGKRSIDFLGPRANFA